MFLIIFEQFELLFGSIKYSMNTLSVSKSQVSQTNDVFI